MRLAFHGFPISVALAALLASCAAASYERDADRDVDALLRDRSERTLAGREEEALRPTLTRATSTETIAEAQQRAAEPPTTRVLSLREALDIAIRTNRDYISNKETLYLTTLSLTGTQYAYSPRVAAVLSYLFAGSDLGPEGHGAVLASTVTQVLPWGGSISLGAGSQLSASGGDELYDSSLSIRLTQPLLRGAGHDVAWEALRQAERNVVYAIRGFELFREDFSIAVAARFYDLVQQKQALENQRSNLDGFVFGRQQAEALFVVGRTNELEVLRARRSELTSQNSLIAAEESYQLALDRFRIFLGLPDSESVDVRDEEPPFVPVDYDVESAVEVALANRLDWLSRQDQLEDVRRGVDITRNGLLPDFGLSVDYGVASRAEPDFGDQRLEDESYRASLSLEIPLQRVLERNAYRAAQIAHASAIRAVDLFRDDMIVSVRSAFRELARRRQSLEIQTQLIADQERNVKIAQLRFEQGNFSNRDVVEAQEALLDARNALIREKVGYELARLGLLQALGILFIDEKGMWKE